ncbi:uncharacterized protein yc1106_04287 [Curvularia clavata]|uniref:Uncharacterized protein n=1 Tax=Curvularia clavata TaxID=95742 RepID=A0A9Q8ZAY1_CURCL|nr:uncharacterized protein yc1106_04287 [Curvularia clavata]
MLMQPKHVQLKQQMQALKSLYLSRHYTQCARSGERLLGEVDRDVHPIHLAYLNFYTALSHDTLAREATLKNRYKELVAAEDYYNAAIAALSLPLSTCSTPTVDDELPSTPESATFPAEQVWLGRLKTKSSNLSASRRTSSSSMMSDAFGLEQDIDLELRGFCFPSPPQISARTDTETAAELESRHLEDAGMLSPLSRHPMPPKPVAEVQLPPGTSSFVEMLQNHLASVHTLKGSTGIHGVRSSFSTPSASPTKSQFRSTRTGNLSYEQRDDLQQRRRHLTLRPRFDPASIRKLCDEALAEL